MIFGPQFYGPSTAAGMSFCDLPDSPCHQAHWTLNGSCCLPVKKSRIGVLTMRANQRAASWGRYLKDCCVCNVLVVLLGLVTLVGCQGLSAGPATQSSSQSGDLTLSSSALDFGSVTVGASKKLTVTGTNKGTATVTITSATSSALQFALSAPSLPLAIAAGQSATLTIAFTPKEAGTDTGTISFSSNASNGSSAVSVSGAAVTAGQLSPNPASVDFGSAQVGNNKTLPEILTNTGGSNLTISQDTVSGAAFSVSGLTPPITLTPGQNYTFSVIFAPQSAGSLGGNLTITSDASNPSLVIPLSGTATGPGQLEVNPSSLNFGNVVVGTSSPLAASLQASGASVTVTSANSSSPEFTVTGLTLPVTIQAGQSAHFSVTFTPQATGAANATITFISNASNSPTVQGLSGNGTPPPQHNVQLFWTASSSSDIIGYNIYRSITSGGPYSKINASLDAATSYTDSSVVDGQTYYYVTTAVDSNNQESAYSNQASAPIPPP